MYVARLYPKIITFDAAGVFRECHSKEEIRFFQSSIDMQTLTTLAKNTFTTNHMCKWIYFGECRDPNFTLLSSVI